MLGDLRGIIVSSSLTPGDKIGQADLTIKVAPGAAYGANLDADNGGSIFTGQYRVNAGFDWYNPTGHGDIASLRAQATTNLGAKFVRASWLTPINSIGTRLGLAASFLKYELGTDTFDPLDADGTAEAYALQLLHPLIRSRNNNLFLQASTDFRRFEDRVQAIGLVTKKEIAPYATLGVVGDFRDTFAGGGITNYSLGAVGGKLKIKNPEDVVVDQENYNTAGKYLKVQLGVSRLQVLPNRDYLYLSALAQYATHNLDSSEKFASAARNGVRAYPSPESPTDSGPSRPGSTEEPADRGPARRDRGLGLRRLRGRPAAPAQARHRHRQHAQARGPWHRRDLCRQPRAPGQELRSRFAAAPRRRATTAAPVSTCSSASCSDFEGGPSMNKHFHRLVFDRSRGFCVAVAETVAAAGKSASGERRSRGVRVWPRQRSPSPRSRPRGRAFRRIGAHRRGAAAGAAAGRGDARRSARGAAPHGRDRRQGHGDDRRRRRRHDA